MVYAENSLLRLMYIKTDRDTLTRIRISGMDSAAEFSDNNIAHVTEDDGEVLLNEHPEKFSEHNPSDSE